MNLPYSFANKTKSDASKVQANFDAIALRLTQIENYKASVYLGYNTGSIGQNVVYRIPYDSEWYDPAGGFDAVTDKVFWVPVSGAYRVTAKVLWRNLTLGENVYMAIRINGFPKIEKALNTVGNAYGIDPHVTGDVYANTGDYIEVVSSHNQPSTSNFILSGVGNTFFDVSFISP